MAKQIEHNFLKVVTFQVYEYHTADRYVHDSFLGTINLQNKNLKKSASIFTS